MLSELGVSPEVSLGCSVRQGDSLSCCLSLFVGEIVIRHCSYTPYTMSGGTQVSTLGFADDTCCIAGSREDLQQMMDFCGGFSRLMRIGYNMGKCDLFGFCGRTVNGVREAYECDPVFFDAFDRESGTIRRIRIDPTPMDKHIRHLGVWYNSFGDGTKQDEQLVAKAGQLVAEALRQGLSPAQFRSCNNGTLVPAVNFAPAECAMSSKTAFRISAMYSRALKASVHELPSASGHSLYCPFKCAGRACVSVPQERISAMASDMLIALVDTSLKGQVYRERYDAGIEGSTEGNFVCRAISELSEFGVFVRNRKNEEICRLLDILADAEGVGRRTPVTGWGASTGNERVVTSSLFSDISPLGRCLHKQANLLRGNNRSHRNFKWESRLFKSPAFKKVVKEYAPVYKLTEIKIMAALQAV